MAERSIDRVTEAAKQANLTINIVAMPQTTRTAEDAAAACGTSVAQIVKSLVFGIADTDDAVMLLVSGVNRVHEKQVGRLIGGKLKRIDANDVRNLTGFSIGGVSPLGSRTPLKTFIDKDLMEFDSVWAAAGSPNSVFQISPDELVSATRAEIISMS